MLRIAILDDYQSVARSMADWSRLGPDVEIVSFDRHLSEAEAADELAAFDVLCIMRERMALPRNLIEALPRLKLIAVTGSHTQVIDVQAAQARGIPVTLTAPRASNSAALTGCSSLGSMAPATASSAAGAHGQRARKGRSAPHGARQNERDEEAERQHEKPAR
jgi:D-3-phosphoglycerate dehydrogenase